MKEFFRMRMLAGIITEGEYKQLLEGTNVTITHGSGSIQISASGAGGGGGLYQGQTLLIHALAVRSMCAAYGSSTGSLRPATRRALGRFGALGTQRGSGWHAAATALFAHRRRQTGI